MSGNLQAFVEFMEAAGHLSWLDAAGLSCMFVAGFFGTYIARHEDEMLRAQLQKTVRNKVVAAQSPNLQKRVRTILSSARQLDWRDGSFQVMKAHICAELSAIVYEDVQDYELKHASRIHLFASDRFREIVKSGKPTNTLALLMDGDFEARFFVVRGRYAVVLGTFFNDVLFLSVRGTVFSRLWDWKVNIDCRKYHVPTYGQFDDMFFHRGFFEAIVPMFREIAIEAQKKAPRTNRYSIVWTGHSLGGAMAAVGAALSNMRIYHSDPNGLESSGFRVETVDAYTFGMPRYCGLGAICHFPGPHHIYKAEDLVPTVPLRSMNFADCSREYEITDAGTVELTERTDFFGLAGHVPKLFSSLAAHSMEGYAASLANAVRLPRP
jgi:Lipase (class 3)